MQDKQKTDNTRRKPYVEVPDKTAKNSNPRSNENIQPKTGQQKSQNHDQGRGVGSEITDGEDG
jgi:hypothetical protein